VHIFPTVETRNNDAYTIVLDAEYVAFTGCTVSFIAASIMFFLLVGDPNSRAQMRPRLMIVLAGIDMLAGFTFGLANLPIPDSPAIQKPFFAILLGGNVFLFSSFTWTCLVAFHAYIVIATGLESDSEEERTWEKRYLWVLFVTMGCIYLPLVMVFGFKFWMFGFEERRRLNLAFFVCQYASIFIITIRIHFVTAQNPAARKYFKQIILFMLTFLLLTMSFLIEQILGETNPRSDIAYDYIVAFPGQLFCFMGLANALIWGLSATCMANCIKKCYGGTDADTGSRRFGSELQLPLLHLAGDDAYRKNHRNSQQQFTLESGSGGNPNSSKSGGSTMSGRSSNADHWNAIPLGDLRFGPAVGMGSFGVVHR
jgi:hypothetical protein